MTGSLSPRGERLNRIRLTNPLRRGSIVLFYFFGGEFQIVMANRKGVFIGAYVPLELKESLQRRAASEHRTLSQEITRILTEAVHGKGLPAGSIDRRQNNSAPRRRASDPLPRRRAGDLAYVEPDESKK